MLVLCVCVCLCVCLSVCLPRDLRNVTLYHCASFTSIKRFSWQVAQTVFQAYMMCGSRGKVLELFGRLLVEGRARTVTLLVTLGRMNLVHHLNAVGILSKVTH